MVLDLTLNAIQIPGLPTFNRIFGTKKADGKGLTTAEVNANMLAPWNRQRPFTVAETSSTGIVEANACITLAGADSITLGNGAFTGVRVLLINTTSAYVQLITGQEIGWILPYQTIEVMWFGDSWYVCDGKMVGEIINVTFPIDKVPFGYLTLHSGLRPSRNAYRRLAVSFTCTTASPSVFTTSAAHGFVGGERLRLFTTGALTGATLGQDYFVEYISTTTFYLNTTEGGSTRLAITAQSGTHTYQCSAYGVGDGSTTFDLPDPRQSAFVGAGSGTTHNIASADLYVRGQWKDDQLQNVHGQIWGGESGTGVFGSAAWWKSLGSSGINMYTFQFDFWRYTFARTGYNSSGTLIKPDVTRGKSIGANYLIKY